ncbi:MAG: chromosomal replication initiator protein DnaA [Oscillospiraceae bacterium]|nr:chromosomal replication initiator protein DnaA [Oscillospiraceae bacterium]
MESFLQAWNSICEYCKEAGNLTDIAYSTWIGRITPVSIDFGTGVITLRVPTEFHKKLLIKSYGELLNEAFVAILGSPFEIQYITDEDQKKQEKPKNEPKDDYEFTFDTFIVGSSNKFAHAAAVAVAENPAMLYNPLFIYGNPGLGKTHLLYAIAKAVGDNNPDAKIVYVKGDDFTNEMIESIRQGTTPAFREKYRKADVLLVDDVQFIGGKESTQEEFFHTFNTLYETKKQIVLTSDRPPKDIATLEERLQSRFEWGLTADIQPPDFETRIAIIRRKAELLHIDLPDEVAEHIAKKLKTNIRQLEGAVKKIQAQQKLTGVAPSIQSAQAAISDIINNDQPAPVTIEKIIDEVARTYGTTAEDIRSPKRQANISLARQIAVYVVREVTQQPLEYIGKEFGNRNHSTMVYAVQQVEKMIKKDPKTKNTVEDIIKNIRNR